MIGKGGVITGTVVVGAIVADAGLILFGQGANIPWSEDVKNLGFPVLVAIAAGLALRALGKEFLKGHNRYIDFRISEEKRTGKRISRLAKQMAIVAKLLEKLNGFQETSNELMATQGVKLTKISAQLSEQTGVIKDKGT